MTIVRCAIYAAAALLLASCGRAPPTDKDMTAAFLAKRAAFEALRQDLCKLRYDQTITRDWVQPQMPAADEKRLRARLDAIGAVSVKYLRGCQFWIEMWSSGIGAESAYKKYRYGPPLYRIIEVKEPPRKDLNTYLKTRVSISSFEKKIDGDWWIEIDHWL